MRVHVWLCDCSRVLALPPQRDGSDAVRISVTGVQCADRDRRVGRRVEHAPRLAHCSLVATWGARDQSLFTTARANLELCARVASGLYVRRRSRSQAV